MDWKIVLMRLLLATLAGAVIGIDRERIGQAAGLRTYIVVTNASALCTMTAIYISSSISQSDIARMPSAFISGLGFLGAGAIWTGGNREVKGLTTAAGLWASAVTGIAFGAGFYVGGGISFLISFFAIAFLDGLVRQMERHGESGHLYCEIRNRASLKLLLSCAESNGAIVSDLKVERLGDQKEEVAVTMMIREGRDADLNEIMKAVRNLDCVTFALYI